MADAGVVTAASWLVVRALGGALPGLLEPLLAWAWAIGAVVAASGVILGAAGALGAAGFAASHLAILGLLMAARRGRLADDLGAGRRLLREAVDAASVGGGVSAAVVGLLALLGGLSVLAAVAQPGIYDALTYRLPRIAQWLQDGRVGHFAANDPRQNYMPVVPDLVMAWLLGSTADGYRPSLLVEAYGGALLMAATYGLARHAGLGRLASLGAVGLLFSMASVVLQFAAADTDLFVAGELAAAFVLWLRASVRGEGSWIAGLGAGLALGAKGTVFYLAPGALIWVAWAAWSCRPPLRAWAVTVTAATLSAGLFAVPVFVRNGRAYGGPFGPADFVRMHHGEAPIGQAGAKLRMNLESSLAQLFDPHSQPPGFEGMSRAAGETLARSLPQRDPFSYDRLDRRQTLLDILERPDADADKESFGVLAFAGLLAGALAAAARPGRPGAGSILAWSAGTAVFWVFFLGMQLWHPYGFRYYLLVSPVMAVAFAWALEGLSGPWGRLLWAACLAAAAGVAWKATTATPQAGWLAATAPERAGSYAVYAQLRGWVQALDSPGDPLRPCLPYNQPVAAFYRLPGARRVEQETTPASRAVTAEAFLAGRRGWLVVPAGLFMGREGRVVGRTLLPTGEAQGPFSVAAYRLAEPGEVPPPLVYRRRLSRGPHRLGLQLLVRTWSDAPLRLWIDNPGASPCRFHLASPVAAADGSVPAGGRVEVQLPTAAAAVGEIAATIEGAGDGPGADLARVELADLPRGPGR